VILADIDHFKAINDRFGHPFGDLVLARFGALLREHAGNHSCVVRLGGEEFAILLPGASLIITAHVAEQMRAAFHSQSWPQPASDSQFSASFGATLIREGEDFSASIARADKLLYLAKNEGRNNVVTCQCTCTRES